MLALKNLAREWNVELPISIDESKPQQLSRMQDPEMADSSEGPAMMDDLQLFSFAEGKQDGDPAFNEGVDIGWFLDEFMDASREAEQGLGLYPGGLDFRYLPFT